MKILAVITQPQTATACLDAAACASAALAGARIEALHVNVDPEKLVAASEEIQIQRMREQDEGSPRQREEAVRAAFLRWNLGAHEQTPEVDFRSITSGEESGVEHEASDAALIVIARGSDMDTGDAFHSAIFEVGKPVLWVPGDWQPGHDLGFEHVAIGVDESDAERAAIEAGRPWIEAASAVTAIRIDSDHLPEMPEEGEIAGNVTARWHVAHRQADTDLGAQLAQEARSIGADLLVCGAYRHGRLIEWLLGGTTRHLLAATEVPLLIAH